MGNVELVFYFDGYNVYCLPAPFTSGFLALSTTVAPKPSDLGINQGLAPKTESKFESDIKTADCDRVAVQYQIPIQVKRFILKYLKSGCQV